MRMTLGGLGRWRALTFAALLVVPDVSAQEPEIDEGPARFLGSIGGMYEGQRFGERLAAWGEGDAARVAISGHAFQGEDRMRWGMVVLADAELNVVASLNAAEPRNDFGSAVALDGDGVGVLVGARWTEKRLGKVFRLEPDGTVSWTVEGPWREAALGTGLCVDPESGHRYLFGSGLFETRGLVMAVDRAGRELWQRDLPSTSGYGSGLVEDLDEDGVRDLAFTVFGEAEVCRIVSGATGEMLWKGDVPDADQRGTRLAVLRADGRTRLLVATTRLGRGGAVWLLEPANPGPARHLPLEVWAREPCVVSLGDLDGDGWDEFAIGANTVDASGGPSGAPPVVFLVDGQGLDVLQRLHAPGGGRLFGRQLAVVNGVAGPVLVVSDQDADHGPVREAGQIRAWSLARP